MNTAKIIVNGKEYSLLFGYTCYKLFMVAASKKAVLYIDGKLTDEGAVHLIYSAYISYCLDKNIDQEISFDDIYEAVDILVATEDGLAKISEYYTIFLKSKQFQKLIPDEDEKKNQGETVQESSTSTS